MTDADKVRKAREHMAGILRDAAQLIEEGVIEDWELNLEWGHRVAPDPLTGGYTMRHVRTGEDTVTIVLKVGALCRARAPRLAAAETLYSNTQGPMLPRPYPLR